LPKKKKKITGTDFELYIYKTIRRNFPLWRNWDIHEQPTVKRGYRPDFVVRKRKPHAVIDAKDKAVLELRDIDQILAYKNKLKAKKAIIYVANDTEVPQTVKEYAGKERVEVRRSLWRY
jgi:hypothetical protein